MNININNQQNFTGYDARRLKGLLVTDKNCATQLKRITEGTGIEIFTPEIASKSKRNEYEKMVHNNNILWAQDYFAFSPDKIAYDGSREYLERVLNATARGIQNRLGVTPVKAENHIRGGRYFICDVNGDDKVLICNDFVPPQSNCCPLPKLDYHLDLYIRPLDEGKVLVSDNDATIDGLNKLAQNFEKYIKENNLSDAELQTYNTIIEKIKTALKCFEISIQYDKRNPKETTPKIIDTLEKNGFKPIKVPANYYYLKGVKDSEREKQMMKNFEKNMNYIKETSKNFSPETYAFAQEYIALQRYRASQNKTIGVELEKFYYNNFINAIVFKDKNDNIHYITNAPLLDKELGITPEIEAKTGLSTRNMFIKSISPYVKKENIHFINENLTEKLFKYMGGIHCSAAEIPA